MNNIMIKLLSLTKININEFLILMILSSLMLATFFYPFGFPLDYGSRIIFSLWLPLVIFFFLHKRNIDKFDSGFITLIFILILSIVLGVIKAIIHNEYIDIFFVNVFTKAAPKILFLILFYSLVKTVADSQVVSLFYRSSQLFLLTIPISILCFYFFPLPRYVFYPYGLELRFAAFHYELVNFSYTALTSGTVLIYYFCRKKSTIAVNMILLNYLVYKVSLSNYVPLFSASILLSLLLFSLKKQTRFIFYCLFFVIIIFALIFLPLLLEYLEKGLFLFPRSSNELSDTNPIYIRLYRHIFAMQYFFDNLYSLPFGLFNGGINADLKNSFSWSGGAGMSKLFMDLQLLIVPIFGICIFACLKAANRINRNNTIDQMVFIIFNMSIIYVYLQAGFFNFTVMGFIFLSLRYWRVI
jgi:hypothetical protein